MDKKDRYGRDRPFSGPVDRDNGRREREGPLFRTRSALWYIRLYAVGYTIILRGHGKATTLHRGDRTFFFSRLTRGQPGTLRNS